MPKVGNPCLKQARDALRRYEEEVEATALQEATRRTCLRHAEIFRRWLDDDFEPGANVGEDRPPPKKQEKTMRDAASASRSDLATRADLCQAALGIVIANAAVTFGLIELL